MFLINAKGLLVNYITITIIIGISL